MLYNKIIFLISYDTTTRSYHFFFNKRSNKFSKGENKVELHRRAEQVVVFLKFLLINRLTWELKFV